MRIRLDSLLIIFTNQQSYFYSHQRTEQILRYLEIDPEKDNTNWEELRDNRDFNVVQNWAPAERAFSDDLQEDSFQEEVRTLELYRKECLSIYQG